MFPPNMILNIEFLLAQLPAVGALESRRFVTIILIVGGNSALWWVALPTPRTQIPLGVFGNKLSASVVPSERLLRVPIHRLHVKIRWKTNKLLNSVRDLKILSIFLYFIIYLMTCVRKLKWKLTKISLYLFTINIINFPRKGPAESTAEAFLSLSRRPRRKNASACSACTRRNCTAICKNSKDTRPAALCPRRLDECAVLASPSSSSCNSNPDIDTASRSMGNS